MTDIEGLVQEGTLKKYQVQRNNRVEAPCRNKRKQKYRGRGRCGDNTNKKPNKDSDEGDDAPPQFDGIVAAITGLPSGVTRSSLKVEVRSPQQDEPTNKRLRKDKVITFSDEDPVPNIVPHQDTIFIQAGVANKLVHRVYVDSGASVSILFKECFNKWGLDEARLTPEPLPLRSFTQEEARPDGVRGLPITIGKAPTSSTTVIQSSS